MLTILKSQDRGQADHGWLKSRFSFSFADYYDPAHMGFATLRVINEDHIEGGMGFDTHPHRDMEIITYVVSGALAHKDSMGNSTTIQPDEVQRMSAGTGVRHSEFNYFKDQTTHLLQIWIMPEKKGIAPSYGQKSFKDEFRSKDLVLVTSKEGRDGSISLNQDADMYIGRFKPTIEVNFPVRPGRNIWLQLIKGDLTVNSQSIQPGDGVSTTDEKSLKIATSKGAEFILFDLN